MINHIMTSRWAGSGKSKVIDNITNWVNYILSGAETGQGGAETDQPLIVKCAFTGAGKIFKVDRKPDFFKVFSIL